MGNKKKSMERVNLESAASYLEKTENTDVNLFI